MAKFKLPEPVDYEYRWLNPCGMPGQEQLPKWNPVNARLGATVMDKVNELKSYRYDGKVIYEVRSFYTHNQLVQALTDLGDEIAGRFSSPHSNYELVIKHIVKELLA